MLSSMRAVVALLALILPVSAMAQSTFYEAYDHGIELQGENRYQEAREQYLAAVAIYPEPQKRIRTYALNFLHDYDPYLRLAQVEIELGLLEDAKAHLELSAAAAVSPYEEIAASRTALSEARKVLQATEAKSPTPPPQQTQHPRRPPPRPTPEPTLLKVDSNPAGAEVFVDGALFGITPARIPIEPGDHRVKLRIDGYRAQEHVLSVAQGSTRILSTQLHRVEVPTPTPTRVPGIEPAQPKATAAPPTQIPAAETITPTPSENAATAAGPGPGISIPVASGLLAVVVVGLALLVSWSRAVRHRRAAGHYSASAEGTTLGPSGNSLLVDELSIDDSSDFELPDSLAPAFGNYTLKQVLGRGGMATTYHATRNRDDMSVALKIPHDHLLHRPEFVERFSREGALGVTVHHPNIVRIFEAGTVGNRPFIAMELVKGATLQDVLKVKGRLALREALEVTRGIALALDYAHGKGIVHRDLKPANVMMLPDWSVKVMDFGLAHIADAPTLTVTDQFMGTPLFSAPESASPTHTDHRTDLYSLGIILYLMFAGRLPFEADSPLRVLEMHQKDSLPPFESTLQIPSRVQDLVKRLTAKEKTDRVPSAEVLLAELNVILHEI